MHKPTIGLAILFIACTAAVAAPTTILTKDMSFQNEVQRAIDRGLSWLQTSQNSNGWWSSPDQPALTALAVLSFKGDPRARYKSEPEWLKQSYRYLLGCVHPDGGIHQTNLVTYNTSLCMMALLAADKSEYDPIILNARQFLIGLQGDFGKRDKLDSPFDGGIGYGSHYEHSDMGNTAQALEAIYYSRHLSKNDSLAKGRDLNWNAAIHFLESCQNLPSHNTEKWASDDPQNKGGFIYYPGHSMAGSVTNPATGRVALRSYGSISYAGMMSYFYADLKRNDPRVQAVFEWLRKNYTVEENPALGLQGLYYYYHTMAKALGAYGLTELELADGRKVSWRIGLGKKLLDLQRTDGSWVNDNGRWWEKDPVLVTSFAVLSLEMVSHGF